MNRLNLGNDFTEEGGSAPSDDEKEVKKPDGESGDEKENSTDSSDSENQEKADESIAESKEESKGEKPEEESKEDKQKVLQGLLDTEKDLDKSHSDIDASITAARQRISQQRKERREKRDIVDTIDSKFPDEEEDLSDIDSETLKVLDKYTRAKGLIPKSELNKITYQTQHDLAQDSFYEAHPEYNADNDPNNILYDALKKELADFIAPTNPKDILKKFEKAHSFVKQLYPDKFAKKLEGKSNDENINKSIRLKTAGLGGKSSGGSGSSDKSSGGSEGKTWSDIQISALRNGGWSEKEIQDLLK